MLATPSRYALLHQVGKRSIETREHGCLVSLLNGGSKSSRLPPEVREQDERHGGGGGHSGGERGASVEEELGVVDAARDRERSLICLERGELFLRVARSTKPELHQVRLDQ